MVCAVHFQFLDTQGSVVGGGSPWNCRDAPEVTGMSRNSRGCQRWPLRAGSAIPRGLGLAITLPPALPSPGRKSGTLWETGPGD